MNVSSRPNLYPSDQIPSVIRTANVIEFEILLVIRAN
jgi:hypothetical protein